jgi:hypothetical protein
MGTRWEELRRTARMTGHWWAQGARSACLMRPRWEGLEATPAVVATLVVANLVLAIGIGRLAIDGAATFNLDAIRRGWIETALFAWTAWMLSRWPRTAAASIGPARLLAMLFAQQPALALAVVLLNVPLSRQYGLFLANAPAGTWYVAMAPFAWAVIALARLLAVSAGPDRPHRMRAFGMTCVVLATYLLLPSWGWWFPVPAAQAAEAPRQRLTQTALERQAALLPAALAATATRRTDAVEVWAITFAPDADDEVFLLEGRRVAALMRDRFDATGHTLELANHRAALETLPWATPENLHRAIAGLAQRMDREHDVLFLHLTAHGSRDGRLTASLPPLDVDPVTPRELRAWLDEAGIRRRIVSVSACYSGRWIEPLRGPDTLVMTAADATHTSLGCGRGDTLTFFGRALYDEQLAHTRNFEQALRAARAAIGPREVAAGKSDGPSNPQIAMGEALRPVLQELAQRLDAASAPAR